jgi:adhesin transport system membrane fusion protein
VLLKSGVKESIRRYFKGSASLQGQPLPEVNKALIEDAPRVVRLTIWASSASSCSCCCGPTSP